MTTNQLRYWELRWKQWYEYQLLQHKKAELTEQKRATRVKERQEYMKITIDREDLERKWEELSEKKRAAMVGEAIDKYKADTTLLDVQSKIQDRLENQKLATADLALGIAQAADKHDVDLINAYANAAKTSWGTGIIGAGIGESRALLSREAYQGIADEMAKTFPQYAQYFKIPDSSFISGTGTTNYSGTSKVIDTTKSTEVGPGVQTKHTFSTEVPQYAKDAQKKGYLFIPSGDAKVNAGIQKETQIKPVARDNYYSSPQSNIISSNSVGSKTNGPSVSYSTPSNKSGVIMTTNIHKGPGY